MDATPTVLVVEDEADIRNLLLHGLSREGYDAVGVGTGPEALRVLQEQEIALVVLDLMLPGMSGTEVCRSLRGQPRTRHVPVLMLTARSDEIDRIVGFEVGADDYVTKPFSARELMLRVRALLRRAAAPPLAAAMEGRLELPGLSIDERAHRVWVDGGEVTLTPTEFKLLVHFARRSGSVLSRAQLLREVWEMPPTLDTRTVDTHVARLREKLGRLGGAVEAVRGVGYRFTAPAA